MSSRVVAGVAVFLVQAAALVVSAPVQGCLLLLEQTTASRLAAAALDRRSTLAASAGTIPYLALSPAQVAAAAGQVILRPIQLEQMAVLAVVAHTPLLRQVHLRLLPVGLGILRPRPRRRDQTAAQDRRLLRTMERAAAAVRLL